MNARDLFLSHSSDDVEVARELRSVLEAAGYSCWMAPDDVVGTETWTEQVLAAIDDCRAMVVLISANANASPHVSREVNLALGRKHPVLPIRIESVAPDGSLEYLLSLVQRVDAFPAPIGDHASRITRRLNAILRPDATPPPPPAPPDQRTKGETSAEPVPADVATQPAATEPAGTEPAGAKPAGTKPAGTKPAGTEPAGSRPVRRTPRPRGGAARPRTVGPIGPGSVIDDFTLESLLGEGGMGRVYRARQAEPDRAVALKVIRPDHAADDTYRQRFLAEKNTLAGLEHPSIVPIYAAGQVDEILYIAMRLIDGSDLQARIAAQGHLSLRETVQVLKPIADAIDHAHAAGVIHRDLKPSNIILDRAGRPYLTDFGLGKHVEKPSQLSVAGIAFGTLDYMAPEQFTGTGDPALATRIDVYALGCVIYACLTGRPPFVKDTPEQLMYAHNHEGPPPPRTLRPELPAAVDAVLAKSLAKDPKYRFGTATELVAALEAAFTSGIGQTRPVPLPPGRSGPRGFLRANMPLAIIGTSLAVVGSVVLAAILFGRDPDPGPSNGPSDGRTSTPGPVSDTTPPTGGSLAIVPATGFDDLVTSLDVSVELRQEPTDASGVTGMLVANAPTRPALAEALPYADSFTWRLATGTGTAGIRNVYVWFGDRLGNWSEQPVQTSITFDNPPTPVGWEYSFGTPGCRNPAVGDQTMILLPGVATDPDGIETLEIVEVWDGDPNVTRGRKLTQNLGDNGTTITLQFTSGTALSVLTFYYTVRDDHGVEVDGSYEVNLGPAC